MNARLASLATVACLLVITGACGWKGGLGFALGVLAATVNLLGLWRIIKTITQANLSNKGGVVVAIICFAKMPLFLIAGFLSWRIGTPAPASFLAGIALVYSLMIWWASRAH